MVATLGTHNPLRYRGYVYEEETGLYYLQSRYYNPEIGRFINADGYASTGQGLLGNNMFAYCNNNSVNHVDFSGTVPSRFAAYISDDFGRDTRNANIKSMMALFGVQSESEVPDLPDNAMIFVENAVSVVVGNINGIVGTTVVMNKDKYCVYTFYGFGAGISIPICVDKVITEGYVYNVVNVDDYCGSFISATFNMSADVVGGALASNSVYAKVLTGMSATPSLGASWTYYLTAQSDWIYGDAGLTLIHNPWQYNLPSSNIPSSM